ncbi:MAG: hypothetical protein NWE88_13430 [Candidatus Bathyarchaeota archaeon]|nr:hypothetical protein [Candidatus Bathyarchaeota archaeon]
MRGRSKEEIEEAIIVAIRKGNRAFNDIRLSANIANHGMMKRYLKVLIDKGEIKEAGPSIFDHGHVKKIYKLQEAED